MKNKGKVVSFALALMLILSLTKCRQGTEREKTDNGESKKDSLIAYLHLESPSKLSDSIGLTFTVKNPTDDTLRFTQYHTPFEGILNKFLTITDVNGTEIEYVGVMARRVMPPPEDTYHIVLPGEEKSVTFNLLKSYKIDQPGQYMVRYEGQNISGIKAGPPIGFELE